MSLEEAVRHLSRIPMFAQFEPEALRLIAFSAETVALAPGETLFRQDEDSDAGYVVLMGTLVIETSGSANATRRTIGLDTLLGQTALLAPTRRPFTARAMQAVTVMKIPRALFLRVLQAFPDAAARLRGFVAARLTGFTDELHGLRQRILSQP